MPLPAEERRDVRGPCQRGLATTSHLGLQAVASIRNVTAGPGTHPLGDKAPYKTHQGCFVGVFAATGWYFELSPRGTRVGGGFYDATGPRLAAVREAIADEEYGTELQALIDGYEADGWEISGDKLKTAPRGFDVTHPRIDLLRHKQLYVGKPYGFEDDALNADLVERVRADWEALRPLLAWLTTRPKQH